MNTPPILLGLFLLAGPVGGCTTGVATPIKEMATLGPAGAGGMGGVSAGRGGAGGVGGAYVRGGSGGAAAGAGGRSQLQAGSGGDRMDFECAEPTDPVIATSETELLDALNVAIENMTFCPAITRRLTMDPGWRCFTRDVAREQCSDRGRFRPLGPGWSSPGRELDFLWFAKQPGNVVDAKNALLGSSGPPDRRADVCEAAQRGALYRTAGVGHVRDCWVIVIVSDR